MGNVSVIVSETKVYNKHFSKKRKNNRFMSMLLDVDSNYNEDYLRVNGDFLLENLRVTSWY